MGKKPKTGNMCAEIYSDIEPPSDRLQNSTVPPEEYEDDTTLLLASNQECDIETASVPNQMRRNNQLPNDDTVDIDSTLKKRVIDHVKPGSLNIISTKYQSLDYDTCENNILLKEEKTRGYKFIVRKNLFRWLIFLFIGVITAIIACLVDISIEELSSIKYTGLKKYIDKYVIEDKLYIPYLLWIASNVVPVLIGSLLVAYVEPTAAGSGIPQVKCYLNGVKVPRVVRIKTLLVKCVGVVTSVVGGLAGGKEGPMIHSGAVVAAGISQGKSTTLGRDFKVLEYFREDHEKRDFVSGGAASGVSAAFGAPVGGVLFSLEEGASFWNQGLTWRIFFASVVSTFTLNLILSAYHGHPGDLSNPGLLNLGKMESFPYEMYEIPLFAILGAFGGMMGALWNHINYKITVFRMRYLRRPWMKVIEACLVAMATATTGFLTMYLLNDCRPLGQDPTKYPLQLYCGDGEYNAVAAIWFQTPEASVRSLLHDPPGSHTILSLLVFVICYFLLACWTFGLSVSSGLFIPSLLTGAAWGRLFAATLQYLIPSMDTIHPGKYALIGAAAQLGGVVRMTISLTVIILETTGDITNAFPIIVTLMAAKWTGDFFNEGIYDIHIQLAGVPLLPWEPPPLAHNIFAPKVMSRPIVTFKTIENVGHIVEVLHCTSYNGFPVVDPPQTNEMEVTAYKRIRGLILRSQLIVLLQQKIFFDRTMPWQEGRNVDINMFRQAYPRFPDINEVKISDEEKTYSIDLRPFMNPSPYTLLESASLPRMFRLFRALGLRHLPIVNDLNEVVGMVTRKDLARYRVWRHGGKMGVEELLLSNDI